MENKMSQESPFAQSEVQGFINQLDSIINRMGANSANSKNWLMTILAAAIAIQWNGSQLHQVLWLLIPTGLFMLSDMYYLGMERHFKNIQRTFINKVRSGFEISQDIYNIPKTKKCEQVCNTISTIESLSIWPFYSIVIVSILLIGLIS